MTVAERGTFFLPRQETFIRRGNGQLTRLARKGARRLGRPGKLGIHSSLFLIELRNQLFHQVNHLLGIFLSLNLSRQFTPVCIRGDVRAIAIGRHSYTLNGLILGLCFGFVGSPVGISWYDSAQSPDRRSALCGLRFPVPDLSVPLC